MHTRLTSASASRTSMRPLVLTVAAHIEELGSRQAEVCFWDISPGLLWPCPPCGLHRSAGTLQLVQSQIVAGCLMNVSPPAARLRAAAARSTGIRSRKHARSFTMAASARASALPVVRGCKPPKKCPWGVQLRMAKSIVRAHTGHLFKKSHLESIVSW